VFIRSRSPKELALQAISQRKKLKLSQSEQTLQHIRIKPRFRQPMLLKNFKR
jgi:hypothetical protein